MKNTRKILIFDNSYKLTNYLVKTWIDIAKDAIYKNKRFSAAVPGGRTPVEFYSKLSSMDNYYLWQNTHMFLTDERFVPQENRDSNYRMIKENLLNGVPLAPANVHAVKTNYLTVKEAAENYDKDLRRFFGATWVPRFDIVLLGIGEDGHTASLFPGLAPPESDASWVVTASSEKINHERISLSWPVINGAAHIFLLVCGSSKAAIIKQIIEDHRDYPAAKVKPANGQLTVLLDKDSSSQLTVRGPVEHLDEAIVINA